MPLISYLHNNLPLPNLFATDRQTALQSRLSDYLDAEIYPHEAEWLQMPFEDVAPILRSKREDIREIGAWNLYLSPEHGGPGLDLTEVAQIGELLGRTPFGHFLCNCQAPDAGNVELLDAYLTPDLHDRYFQPLLDGEVRSCFAMTEPALAGSNPTRMGTTARREGDDYVINGRKWFTTAADGAAFAIVMANSEPESAGRYGRASMIVVPTDTPGYERVRNISIMGHAGSGWLSHAEVTFTDVHVPAANLLGPAGAGFRLAQERLGPGRIHHCMRWIGIAERCFELMCRRAATRELADGRTIGDFQMVQQWIADSRAEIDSCRYMVLHTAHAMQTEGNKAARDQISAIKFLGSNMLHRVIDRALQAHGALGVTDDTIISWFYREERAARIYDGTDETHKASLAKRILRRYREE